MVFLFIPAVLVSGILIYFLLKMLSRYEGNSVEGAMERIAAVEGQLEELNARLETIEAIESDEPLNLIPNMSDADETDSVSSHERTRSSESD